MSNNVSANNSFAAAFTGQLEKDTAKYHSALVDWAEFASQMETSNGTSKITARLEYRAQNETSGAWTALYGNTTDTQFVPTNSDSLDRATRYCARLNLMYQETRRNNYRAENPHVDKTKPEYSSVEAANDLTWANILVDFREALLHYNLCVAKFNMARNFYEQITGKEFVYVPYVEKPRAATSLKMNAKLAASLLDAA